MSKPPCVNFFNCTQTNDYNHKQQVLHYCKWDKKCSNKNDAVHVGRFMHTCTAEPCTSTDSSHLNFWIHICSLGTSCPGISNTIHMRQFRHQKQCSQGATCSQKTDGTHKEYFIHPCEVVSCNSTDASHRHMYLHACRYGTQCKDTSASHMFSYLHVSSPPSKEFYSLKELASTDPTYQSVCKLFKDTGGVATQIKIFRVENLLLWQKFVATQISEVSVPVVMSLFHGSGESAINEILRRGFDPQLSNTGCAIGIGTYFARDASYSNGYAKVCTDGWKRMFHAKVIVGRSTQGQSGLHHAPKHPDGKTYYESVCNNPSNPNMWCIFDPTQAYPEFLIQYK